MSRELCELQKYSDLSRSMFNPRRHTMTNNKSRNKQKQLSSGFISKTPLTKENVFPPKPNLHGYKLLSKNDIELVSRMAERIFNLSNGNIMYGEALMSTIRLINPKLFSEILRSTLDVSSNDSAIVDLLILITEK